MERYLFLLVDQSKDPPLGTLLSTEGVETLEETLKSVVFWTVAKNGIQLKGFGIQYIDLVSNHIQFVETWRLHFDGKIVSTSERSFYDPVHSYTKVSSIPRFLDSILTGFGRSQSVIQIPQSQYSSHHLSIRILRRQISSRSFSDRYRYRSNSLSATSRTRLRSCPRCFVSTLGSLSLLVHFEPKAKLFFRSKRRLKVFKGGK